MPGTIEYIDAPPSVTDSHVKEQRIGDYWGAPPAPEKWYFPDGIQYFEYVPMNHGMRTKYQAVTQTDIDIEKRTGNMRVKTNLGSDMNHLIDMSTVGWKIYRNNEEVAFSKGSPGSNLHMFLAVASPSLVDKYIETLRKANPWLLGEQSVEDIDSQIRDLQKLREEVADRESGK